MRKVSICIASAAELRSDRLEIATFLYRLNECYLDKGLYFSLNMPGESASANPAESDIACFLFQSVAESSIFEAFDSALDSFNKNSKPQILIYLKSADGEPRADDIVRFEERLRRDTDFYLNFYGHIDTLKLGILMQIRQLDLDSVDIRLEDGKAWQGSEALLALDHVEMVMGYADLQRLKTERAQLESLYYAAKTRFVEHPDDNAAYEAFYEAAKRRNAATQEIRAIETRLYHMIEGMYEQTSAGRLSKRQVEGYRLMERGMFREAQAVLDFGGIVNESRHDEMIAEQASKRAQVHVNEQLQLVDVNRTLGDWDGADACYREAVRLEEAYNLPKKAMYKYADFLDDQNRYAEGIALAERLRYYFEGPNDTSSDMEKGEVYSLLGLLYRSVKDMEKSEQMHKQALEIRKRLVERGGDMISEKALGNSYLNLGRTYIESKRMAEAEEMNKAALEIRASLAGRDPDTYESDLAAVCNNLGGLYHSTQRMAEAEEMYRSAIEIRERLSEKDYDTYSARLATNYSNLALLYCTTNRMAESETITMKALEIRKRMAGANPDAYEPDLVMSYTNLGFLYQQTDRMTEALSAYDAALALTKKLASRNPDAYDPDLVNIYNNLGDVYYQLQRWADSESMHKSALVIAEKLAKSNAEAFEPDLANTLNQLGAQYIGAKRMAEAESALTAALELYQKLTALTPGAFEPNLAYSYYFLGMLYKAMLKTAEAERTLRKALEMRSTLTAASPEAFEPDLAESYSGLGELYKETRRIAQAEEAYASALRLYEKYADNPYFRRKAAEVRIALESLSGMQDSFDTAGQTSMTTQFTPEEREIALMLTEGETQRDIARKLSLTTAEVSRQVNAIREKVVGMGVPDPGMASIVHNYGLSRREAHILKCLHRDMTNAEIAAELYIAEETVRVHIHKLLKKLPAKTRQEAVDWVKSLNQ